MLSSDFICQNAASSAPTVRRCSFPGLTLANPLQPNLSDFTYNGSGRPFYDVPTQGVNFIGTAAPRGGVNAIDPDFELPASWRYALGATWNLDTGSMLGILGGDYRIDADVLYAQTDNAPVILPLGYVSAGKFIDGRPRYTGNTNDFLLSNSDRKSDNWVYSLSVHKDYDFGLDWTLGYAHVYGNETNPMTSVTTRTSRTPLATTLSTCRSTAQDYVVPHRFSFNVNYELELMENFPTKFSLGGYAQEGLPYSYTMAADPARPVSSPTPTQSTAHWPTSRPAWPIRSSRLRRTQARCNGSTTTSRAMIACPTIVARSPRVTSPTMTGLRASTSNCRKRSRALRKVIRQKPSWSSRISAT